MDKRDRTIIYELEKNARISDSKLAKSILLSKQVTNYRIKKLEQQGIILGYYTLINHFALGRQLYRLGLKLRRLTPEKEEEIINFIKQEASWLSSTMGLWDLSLAIYAKDNENFLAFWHSFLSKYSNNIEEKWLATIVKFYVYNRGFMLPEAKEDRQLLRLSNDIIRVELDAIDLKILKSVSTQARIKVLDLAQELNVNERVIRYRLKNLVKKQVILGYRPIIDYQKLGYSYYKIYIKLENVLPSIFPSLYTFIETIPHICNSTISVGGFDLEVEAYCKNSHELYEIIQKFKQAFPEHIKGYSFIEYIKVHKVSYYPKFVGE